jgi:hypothetical protein
MPRDTRGWIIIVCAILAVGSAVNLQMPLYPQYAAAAGFGHTGRALIFAIYILGLVPTLAFAGGASDVLGRRPVVLGALIAAGVPTLAMILFPHLQVLLGARLFHGMAVALGIGSATAWLTERFGDPTRAAWWSSFATAVAFGGGGLITTIAAATYDGGLVPWSYYVGFFAIAFVTIGIFYVPGGIGGSSGRWLRLPAFPPGTQLFTLGNSMSWAVSGIILAQGPAAFAAAGMSTGSGIGVFALCGTGAVVQLIPRMRPSNPTVGMLLGACFSTLALGLFAAGVKWSSSMLLFAACAAAGAAGFGFMFLAGLTAVNAAAGERRAAAVSGYLLWSYVGFGVPSLLMGWLADILGEATALTWGTGVSAVLFTVLLLVVRTYRPPATVTREA